jgi:tripeptidyl-peptidase-1
MRATTLSAFASALLATVVAGRSIPDTHVLHERRDVDFPSGLMKRDRVDSSLVLPMRIGLRQSNLDKAEAWLMEVSRPQSEKYGQYWSQEDVLTAFAPSQDSVDLVGQWLESAGIAKHRITHSDNKQWLAFDATPEEAESLTHAQYHEYEHPKGYAMVGCEEYFVPKHLQEHIDYITPGVKRSIVSGPGITKRSFKSSNERGSASWTPPRVRPASYMPNNDTQLETCDTTITPACIQALYGFQAPDPHTYVSSNNSMGIFEEGDFYYQEDLNKFYHNFTSYIKNGTGPILKSIDGGTAPAKKAADAGGESNLDFMLAVSFSFQIGLHDSMILTITDSDHLPSDDDTVPDRRSICQQLPGYFQYVPGRCRWFILHVFGIWRDWQRRCKSQSVSCLHLHATASDVPFQNLDPIYPDPNPGGYKGQLMCGIYKPTNVISISYGEQEQDLPAYYQKRQCNEWLKLGMQGVSVFVASGDSGVGGQAGDGSSNGCLRNGTVFSPTQPNSCPWLTNVGATKVEKGKTVYDPEVAPDDPAGHPYRSAYYSSGGFSNIFPIPQYQSDAIKTFFKDHNPPYSYYTDGNYKNSTGLYNRNGRGIPDVAAIGDNIAVYLGGKYSLSGGTSASSPVFASIVNRIIEERIKRGKGPLGFINPVLYQHPEVLKDIVTGKNPGCGTEGFSCVPGWDPVTGLGSPSYPKMLDLFLSLP